MLLRQGADAAAEPAPVIGEGGSAPCPPNEEPQKQDNSGGGDQPSSQAQGDGGADSDDEAEEDVCLALPQLLHAARLSLEEPTPVTPLSRRAALEDEDDPLPAPSQPPPSMQCMGPWPMSFGTRVPKYPPPPLIALQACSVPQPKPTDLAD